MEWVLVKKGCLYLTINKQTKQTVMITQEDRTNQFTTEHRALLAKYNATIELEDLGIGYSQDYKMVCYIDSVWADDVQEAESAVIYLGSYLAP